MQVDELVLLQGDGCQLLSVAGVVFFDVLGQIAFVSEPFEAGFEQASEWFFACKTNIQIFVLNCIF